MQLLKDRINQIKIDAIQGELLVFMMDYFKESPNRKCSSEIGIHKKKQ
jgi:hypothetical protein